MDRGVLYFFYGLAYFVLGISVLLQFRRVNRSKLPLAKPLVWLGLFGFIHGFAEWAAMAWYMDHGGQSFMIGKQFLDLLSFIGLFLFGLELLINLGYKRMVYLRPWPLVLTVFWCGLFIHLHLTGGFDGQSIFRINFIYSYFLALPGSILTWYGLNRLRHHMRRLGLVQFWQLQVASYLFLGYGLFSNILIRPQPWFPANIINKDLVMRLLGIPVEGIRFFIAIAITVLVLQIIDIFEWENLARLTRLRSQQAVLAAREEVGREIHDQLIQDIFSLSLYLEVLEREVTDPRFDKMKKIASRAITRARSFLKNSPESTPPLSLPLRLEAYLADLAEVGGMDLDYSISDAPLLVSLPPQDAENIYYIIQESITNALKHSEAKRIEVTLEIRPVGIWASVRDNGKGLMGKPPGVGIGIMAERARNLGAQLSISSLMGGTRVILTIPWARELMNYDQ